MKNPIQRGIGSLVQGLLHPLGWRLARTNQLDGMQGQPFRFREDGLATIHNCDFVAQERFQAAYAAGASTGSWRGHELRWRAHVVCWAAEHALRLQGDFVECGVNRGGFARMIIEYVGGTAFAGRSFSLLDTFNGFVEPQLSATEKQHLSGIYQYPDCLAAVRQTFSAFPFVRIIPGPVPGTLPQVASSRVAFLSVDMNCVGPEIAAAEFFWPRLCPGAVILLDDYGFKDHLEQKLAFDRFAAERGVPLLSLPTGQGLILKP
jgi:hypothetical protein